MAVAGKSAAPALRVDIASHDEGRRNTAQLFEHLWFTDIASMNDKIRAPQGRESLGASLRVYPK